MQHGERFAALRGASGWSSSGEEAVATAPATACEAHGQLACAIWKSVLYCRAKSFYRSEQRYGGFLEPAWRRLRPGATTISPGARDSADLGPST